MGDDNLKYWKDFKKGEIYYLTGAYWDFGECLINEPVKFLYFTDKDGNEIESVGKKRNCDAICEYTNPNHKSVTGLVEVRDSLFICPIDRETKEPMVMSRITGEFVKRNGRQTLNENPNQEELIEAFDGFGEILRNEDYNKKSVSNVDLLKIKWRLDSSLIEQSYVIMSESFDETDYFLNIVDGSDTLEDAWQSYCESRYIYEPFPF